MTLVFETRPVRGAGRSGRRDSLSFFLRGLPLRLADAWRTHRAERELESLPFDLRKDIGFRSTDDRTR